MLFEFSDITLPPIPNKLEGPRFEKFKRDLSSAMFSQRLETFNSESSREGAWKPLSVAHLASRKSKLGRISNARLETIKKKGFGHIKILQDKGILRQSFTPETGPGNAFKHVDIGEDFVRISTNVAYARIQNFGGTIHNPGTENGFGKRIKIDPYLITIPARPFDQFTDSQDDELAELTELYLNGKL